MAWTDVQAKLAEYVLETYAPDNADTTLLAYYGATTLDEVPEHRREEFETDLDYRLGACKNLAASFVMRGLG